MKSPAALASPITVEERDPLALPRLVISDGSLEALKWLALGLMTLDHVNKYLLHDAVPAIFDAGRVVMPLFAIVLAYNLARPGAAQSGAQKRVSARLAIAGAIATLPFVALGGLGWGWWPLNIMATLQVATVAISLFDHGGTLQRVSAWLLLIVGGLFVEFWWPALAVLMAVWCYSRRPTWQALFLGTVGLASLQLVNHNAWALAAVPLVVLASRIDFKVPKTRWVFYAYYPAHLAVIWLVRAAAVH